MEVEVNTAMLEQIKTEWDYNYLLQCLKKLALSTQHFRIKLWSIHIEIYFQSFASTIYHLCHICVIIYKSIFYNWDITLNYCSICKIINIKRNFMSKWPWGPSMWLIYIYIYIYIYSVIATCATSCIFVFKCFNCFS